MPMAAAMAMVIATGTVITMSSSHAEGAATPTTDLEWHGCDGDLGGLGMRCGVGAAGLVQT